MHLVLSVFVVAAYVVVLTFVAVRARAAHEFTEFSLAGRKLPLALVFGSLCATYVGPAFSIARFWPGLFPSACAPVLLR